MELPFFWFIIVTVMCQVEKIHPHCALDRHFCHPASFVCVCVCVDTLQGPEGKKTTIMNTHIQYRHTHTCQGAHTLVLHTHLNVISPSGCLFLRASMSKYISPQSGFRGQ